MKLPFLACLGEADGVYQGPTPPYQLFFPAPPLFVPEAVGFFFFPAIPSFSRLFSRRGSLGPFFPTSGSAIFPPQGEGHSSCSGVFLPRGGLGSPFLYNLSFFPDRGFRGIGILSFFLTSPREVSPPSGGWAGLPPPNC